ncbi:MAG: peptidoglycan-associated lipoprotein Pal [Nitrospinota bacterium]|nr:peptidoglycan-associated lipoprotein Pal [Nitrospinota bacterium]
MPPEIETSSGGIEDSDFTASNTSPMEEETEESTVDGTSVAGEIGGSGGSSSASDFFSEEPIIEGPSDNVGAADAIAENSFPEGTDGSNMGEFGRGGKENIDNGSDGSFSAENPFLAENNGNTGDGGIGGNGGNGGGNGGNGGGNGGSGGISGEQEGRLLPYKETTELQDIHFNFDKYDLDNNAKKTLQQNAQFLKNNPGMRIEIQGHCDERGTNNYNIALGQRRAHSTKKFLVAQGIDSSRVNIISYGEEKPFCFDSNETCWFQNRRAHFMIAK